MENCWKQGCKACESCFRKLKDVNKMNGKTYTCFACGTEWIFKDGMWKLK